MLQKEFLLWNLDILKQLRFFLGIALTSELPYLKKTLDLPLETSHEVVLSSLLKRMSNLQTSQSSKESILSPFHVQGILLINAFSALIPGFPFCLDSMPSSCLGEDCGSGIGFLLG